jgi:hypothetical protein
MAANIVVQSPARLSAPPFQGGSGMPKTVSGLPLAFAPAGASIPASCAINEFADGMTVRR